jgi:hypothetical protein
MTDPHKRGALRLYLPSNSAVVAPHTPSIRPRVLVNLEAPYYVLVLKVFGALLVAEQLA